MHGAVKVVIRSNVLDTVADDLRRANDGLETGGILVGFDDGATIDVRAAGGPGPNATRRSNFFLRDREFAQRFVDDAFARDGSNWIGEWHSHPTSGPVPSELDLSTYSALLDDASLDFQRIVSLIAIPTDEDRPAVAVWVVDGTAVFNVMPEIEE